MDRIQFKAHLPLSDAYVHGMKRKWNRNGEGIKMAVAGEGHGALVPSVARHGMEV